MVLLAKLNKDFALIEEKEGNSLYSQGWYGQYTNKNHLKLDPYETVILLERGRIEVVESSDKRLPLSEVVAFFSNNIPNFLVHYLLYKDLRGRGYVIKRHPKSDKYFELYERGATPNNARHLALVVPMVEGVLFDIAVIDQLVVPDATSLPPFELTQLTSLTPTLSKALPDKSMDGLLVS